MATQSKVVVAHSGARDYYQVAAALAEAGMLDQLVTDLYWPAGRWWASLVERVAPAPLTEFLRIRHEPRVPADRVCSCTLSGVYAFAMRKSKAPFSWKRRAIRTGDAHVGARAGRRAGRYGSALLSYSYYGYSAFQAAPAGVPRILFQLHPHPASVRRILTRELELHPECAESLMKEWELALPESEFRRLVEETRMAEHWIVASSFTRATLIEHGTPAERIHVVPYGIDAERFSPRVARAYSPNAPLKLLFVGTINERKGIRYLLQALELLRTKHVELIVCGRVVDDLAIFKPFSDRVQIRPSVTARELVEAYQAAELFVLPSLAEGFGHVVLESMASGSPVLTTTSTAGPDIVEQGLEGFVVEPARADKLAERLDWALSHRPELAAMGRNARRKAETLTWELFRRRVVSTVRQTLEGSPAAAAEGARWHV
jgi:glycosyltransferase involved in cell wall biosynthesis